MRRIEIKEWYELLDKLLQRIQGKDYTGVYGVPRGGSTVAIWLTENTGLDLLSEPKEGCLVVDDLIDSGKTAEKYKDYAFEVLLDKRDDVKQEWIEFWYENTNQDIKDHMLRINQYIHGLKE